MAAVDGAIVRSAEWRRVRAFATPGPGQARPSLLAVSGEAGAGKSTLWRAGVEAAAQGGQRVLRSEPTASEADLSFAGLSDLLAGVLPEVINGIPGPHREALEVALLLRPAVDQPPTAHAVGLAALAGLRASLAHGPMLLAVDDVQWLDEASLDALVFALRRVTSGPLSVLLAARTEAPADPQTAGAPPPTRSPRGTTGRPMPGISSHAASFSSRPGTQAARSASPTQTCPTTRKRPYPFVTWDCSSGAG